MAFGREVRGLGLPVWLAGGRLAGVLGIGLGLLLCSLLRSLLHPPPALLPAFFIELSDQRQLLSTMLTVQLYHLLVLPRKQQR